MTYIYIDESGDLGFSKQSSLYFVISCIKIDDDKSHIKLSRIPKRIRQRRLSKKHQKTPELKFTNSSKLIREQFLNRINKIDLEIYSLIIKKEYTQERLKDNLPVLYNYLIKILLEKPLRKISNKKILNICLDKCMSKKQCENFENYVKTEFLSTFNEIPQLNIIHESSQNNPCLQVIDFICGSFGYKYNTLRLKEGCEYYTDLIKDRIVLEKNDFFRK
ncbi:MAG: DUF3800 domain-containing protein [Nanoarchaeota archaeon]|nr:DUF3800 domain-containing protein [Nanoarchaeota archaeon]